MAHSTMRHPANLSGPRRSDVIERTARTGTRIDVGRGVSGVDRPGGQTLEHAGPAEQNPEKAPWCLFRTGGFNRQLTLVVLPAPFVAEAQPAGKAASST